MPMTEQARDAATTTLEGAGPPSTSAAAAMPSELPGAMPRGQVLLLEFLREHDADCPLCGYNLRALTRPVCPECKQDLVLTVGAMRLRLGWLMLAVAPCFFSGIAACFLAIPTTGVFFEDGELIWPFIGAILFGWISGLFAILLVAGFRGRWRNRFLAKKRREQMCWAFFIWFVHFLALVTLVAAVSPYWN